MFLCPECGVAAFAIGPCLDLPPDGDSDEITVQLVACGSCAFACAATYEESRRGSMDRESFHHVWFRLPPEDLARLQGMLAACPDPRNPRCRCPTHRSLGVQTEGRWDGLERNGFHSLGGGAFREGP